MGEDQRWYIIGVLARGEGVCGSYLNFHTKTSDYTEFIDAVITRVEGNFCLEIYFATTKINHKSL